MLDFNAGKYAPYVWPAYGITAAVLGVVIAESLARARRWRRALDHIQKSEIQKAQIQKAQIQKGRGE